MRRRLEGAPAQIESRGVVPPPAWGSLMISPWMDGEDACWRASGAGVLRTARGNGSGSEPLRGRPAGGRATHEHVHGSRLVHWEKQRTGT
jgi:hypothetical protein